MNTVKIYINHDNPSLKDAFISWLRLFGYVLTCEGKECDIKRMEFTKEKP